MRKSYFLSLLLAGASLLPAAAQKSVMTFPHRAPVSQTAVADVPTQNILKAPSAIDDKSQGLLMYAGEHTDYQHQRGFVKFRSNNISGFDKLAYYYDDSYQTSGIRCGVFNGDKYYAYVVSLYTYYEIYDPPRKEWPECFVSVDLNTGKLDTLHLYTPEEHDNGLGWPQIYDMRYDPSTEQIWALGTNYETDPVTSRLFTVDPTDGSLTQVMTLDFIAQTFAFDYDGNMYMVQLIGDDEGMLIGSRLLTLDTDNFETKKSVDLTLDGNPFMAYYTQSLGFDFSTGDLWWLASNSEGYQRVAKVDENTGVMTTTSTLTRGNTFLGLHIPYVTADAREAAARVAGLDAKPSDTGALKATLSWTNPTKAWNKTDLTQLEEVLIYRNNLDEPVAKLAANNKLGEAMEWTDENAESGINTYYVIPCRVSGEKGILDSIRCYVGTDVPAAVQNVKASLVDGRFDAVKLTWDAPEDGNNNGYVNPDEIKYTITRYPDGVVVADKQTERTFTDEGLTEYQAWYYEIQASNGTGAGAVVETEKIMAGPAINVPLSLAFPNIEEANRWKIIDADNNGSTFYFRGGWDEISKCMTIFTDQNGSVNDWVISPPIALEAGKTYRIKSNVGNYFMGSMDQFKFTMGQSQTVEGQTHVLRTVEDYISDIYDSRRSYEDYFTAPETGTYYYGFHCYTSMAYDEMRLYGIEIEEVLENDLAATDITNFFEAVAQEDNVCKVIVVNKGSKTQSNYKVSIVNKGADGDVVWGETEDVPEIETGQSAEVDVTFKPLQEGTFDCVAVVSLEGDLDPSNDASEVKTITIHPAGTVAWTNYVENDNEGQNTTLPVSYMYKYSHTQSIYYADEIGAKEDGKIHRIGYEYTSNDGVAQDYGPVSVKVYMANTDRTVFEEEGYSYMPQEEMTLVYEGEMTVGEGTNVVSFNLQTPFEYDNTKNLCIAVAKDGLVGHDYPALFRVFNDNMWDPAYYRSTKYQGTSEFSGANIYPLPTVPFLRLAIKYQTSGINNIAIGSNVQYDAASGELMFNDSNVSKAAVYDVSGKLVKNYSISNTQSSFRLGLKPGLYIVRTTATDGQKSSVKLYVK